MTAALTAAAEVQRHHRTLDLALRVQVWATWITGGLVLAGLLWSWTKIGAVTALFGNVLALELKVMLGLGLVATVLGTWITTLLYGWCREYLGQVANRANGQGVNLGRHQALHKTLSAYITATQWASPVSVLILVPLGVWALWSFVTALGNGALGLGLPELILLGLSLALPLTVPIVLNNLILAAVRRWLKLVSARLRGESSPLVTPASQVVGHWFIFCAVLLGLNVLSSLSTLPTLALGPILSSALPDLSELSPALNFSPGLITGVTVLVGVGSLLGAVQNGLLLWTMLASRSFALSTAAVFDALPDAPPLS